MAADDPGRTRRLTREAAELVRAVNHAAYDSPRGSTADVYDRTGAVFALLSSAEQVARMLADDVARLADVAGLRSTDQERPGPDPGRPAESVAEATAALHDAARRLNDAARLVNAAWSALSPLYVELPE